MNGSVIVRGLSAAAGWIDRLEKNAEGLCAHVKYWTDKAKEYLGGAGVVPNGSRDDDSLGEFGYAAGSGWMYSRNGKKPAYAMTSAVFADGEKIALVFSLDLGNDMGGE